jgi:hypothetical protein
VELVVQHTHGIALLAENLLSNQRSLHASSSSSSSSSKANSERTGAIASTHVQLRAAAPPQQPAMPEPQQQQQQQQQPKGAPSHMSPLMYRGAAMASKRATF